MGDLRQVEEAALEDLDLVVDHRLAVLDDELERAPDGRIVRIHAASLVGVSRVWPYAPWYMAYIGAKMGGQSSQPSVSRNGSAP